MCGKEDIYKRRKQHMEDLGVDGDSMGGFLIGDELFRIQ
jgi:hypothetical protein